MYGWIWRHLPGSLAVRVFSVVLLVLAVVALLLFVIYPWLDPLLPFNDVTVD